MRSTRHAATPYLAALILGCASPVSHAQFVAPQVEFEGPKGPVTVKVELARTPEEQSRGLMYRQELAADAGMLFIYRDDADHSFWMKNTYLPLDMIFLDKDRAIVGVVENAEPLTTTSRRVGKPSRYVLEVNAGFCRQHALRAGDRAVFRGIPDA